MSEQRDPQKPSKKDAFRTSVIESREDADSAFKVSTEHNPNAPKATGPTLYESADSKVKPTVTYEVLREGSGVEGVFETFQGKKIQSITINEGPIMERNVYENRVEYSTEAVECQLMQDMAEDKSAVSALQRSSTIKQLEMLGHLKKRTVLETPLERVNRLKGEVNEMLEFLQQFLDRRLGQSNREGLPPLQHSTSGLSQEEVLAAIDARYAGLSEATVKEGKEFLSANPLILMKEIASLRSHLDAAYSTLSSPQVGLDGNQKTGNMKVKITGETASISSGNLSDTIKAIHSHLDKVKAITTKENSVKADSKEGKPFTYEVYVAPSAKSAVKSVQIAALEQRLSEMETALGLSRNAQLSLPFADISSCLKDVVARMLLLHPSRLEQLNKRIETVKNDLDELLTRKEQMRNLKERTAPLADGQDRLDATENKLSEVDSVTQRLDDRRLNDLYDLLERWKRTTGCLPVVVQRLKLLKHLHQEAAGVATRLTTLEEQQNDLNRMLIATTNDFDEFKGLFAENMQWVKQMLASIAPKPS